MFVIFKFFGLISDYQNFNLKKHGNKNSNFIIKESYDLTMALLNDIK